MVIKIIPFCDEIIPFRDFYWCVFVLHFHICLPGRLDSLLPNGKQEA